MIDNQGDSNYGQYKYLHDCVSTKFLPPLEHITPHLFCFLYVKFPGLQKSASIFIIQPLIPFMWMVQNDITTKGLKHYLNIIWWSSCLAGSSSSKTSAWRNASTACISSALRQSSIETDITLLFLRPLLVKECLNLVEALIAFFFRDPSLVFLSSSEFSWSDFSSPEK